MDGCTIHLGNVIVIGLILSQLWWGCVCVCVKGVGGGEREACSAQEDEKAWSR